MSLLALRDVIVDGRRGDRPRLRVPQLQLDAGLVVVVGNNGAGKSTLLDVAAGVLRPTAGVVSVDGQDLAGLSAKARCVAVASLGQKPRAAPDITVFSRIAQGLAPRRGPDAPLTDDDDDAILAVAAALGLEGELLEARLDEVSGGEAQRAHVARALVDERARCVILDEPLAGLDEATSVALVGLLRERARAQLIVVSVHDLGMAALCGGRVLGLRAGEIVVDVDLSSGDGAALNEHAEGLLGSPLRVVEIDGWVGVTRRRADSD